MLALVCVQVGCPTRQQEPLSGGSVPHLSPELLLGDTTHQPHHDIYAFGIIMWDIVAPDCQDSGPYEGRNPQQVAQDVIFSGLRPKFSRTLRLPLFYTEFAKKCWAMDPKVRPTAEELVGGIERMLLTIGVPQPPEWPEPARGAGAAGGAGPSSP